MHVIVKTFDLLNLLEKHIIKNKTLQDTKRSKSSKSLGNVITAPSNSTESLQYRVLLNLPASELCHDPPSGPRR